MRCWRTVSTSEREAHMEARLRRAYDAFNRGDFDAAIGEGVHPEFEYVPARGQTGFTGAEQLRRWMEPDAFETQTVQVLEMRASGDKVLVHQRTTATGAGSGIELDNESWGVWTVDAQDRAH